MFLPLFFARLSTKKSGTNRNGCCLTLWESQTIFSVIIKTGFCIKIVDAVYIHIPVTNSIMHRLSIYSNGKKSQSVTTTGTSIY